MKIFRALFGSFAGLTFSVIAHAAPVQYQLTAIAPQNTWDGFIYGSGDTLTATTFRAIFRTPHSQTA